jgi:hypothetical protein
MKKILIIGVLVSFIFSVLMVGGVFATKDEIIFEAPNGKVTFNHKKHQETLKIDCLKCHHTWKLSETSGRLCRDCHKPGGEAKGLLAKDAFHKNCRGCHDEAKKTNKPAGPTMCTHCHVKSK